MADTLNPTLAAPATELELSIERIDPYLTPARQRRLADQGLTISRFGAVTLAVCDMCGSRSHDSFECDVSRDVLADAYAYRTMAR